MLLWTRRSRFTARLLFFALFIPLFGLPLITIVLMGLAKNWTSALPSGFTLQHLSSALQGNNRASLIVSLVTALLASGLSLVLGTWAALAKRAARGATQRAVDALFLVPVAVPSVVVGLALLVTFSRPPLTLNGLPALVIIAHVVLVTAFAYTTVAGALDRLDSSYGQIAASLGARPSRVLFRITLPLLAPALVAAAGLSFALSMGELGATFMVYPPSWVTLPVTIFSTSDRGQALDAAGLTLILLAATLIVLIAMSRIRTKADFR